MERVHQLIETYQSNYNEWRHAEQNLLQNMTKKQWMHCLEQVIERRKVLFKENNEIVRQIIEILEESHDREFMDAMFQDVYDMYLEQYHDTGFVFYICEKLIAYYEAIDDDEMLLNLYGMAHYENVTMHKYNIKDDDIDMIYNNKSCNMRDKFWKLSEMGQKRIFIALFYQYVSGVDLGAVPVKEALEGFVEIDQFFRQDDIQKIIQKDELLKDVEKFIREGLLIGVFQYDRIDKETKSMLVDYAKGYLDEFKSGRKSDYELKTTMYCCYLLEQYRKGEERFDVLFDKYLDYFEYRFLKVKNGEVVDSDSIIDTINAIEMLGKLTRHINDQEKTNKVVKLFLELVEARWIKDNTVLLDDIDWVLSKVCISFLTLKGTGIDKENSLIQLVIKRNREIYLHGLLVAEIASAIYEEMIRVNPNYYDEITSISRLALKEYLYNAAMIHDIGRTKVYGFDQVLCRDLMNKEIDANKNHVHMSVESLKMVPEMIKYLRVVQEHHKFSLSDFAKDVVDEHYRDLDKMVDLIAIAVTIDEETDSLNQKTGFEFDDVIASLKKRVNGNAMDYIDLIENSLLLQDTLKEIVTQGRKDIMYDVYHNWEKIQLAQDEKSVLDKAIKEVQEYQISHDEERVKRFVDCLKNLSDKSEDPVIRGKALYYLSLYYLVSGNVEAASLISIETTRVLNLIGDQKLQLWNYLNQGTIDVICENNSAALEKYLLAARIASKSPEYAKYENMANVNIAYLYLKSRVYHKALEYYRFAEEKAIEDREVIANIYCGSIIGYAALQNKEQTMKYKKLLMDMGDDVGGAPKFVINLCMAIAYEIEENWEAFQVYYERAKNTDFEEHDVLMFSAESHFFIDILERRQEYEEMAHYLDRFIMIAEKSGKGTEVVIQYAQRRMHCAVLLNDFESIKRCGLYLFNSSSKRIIEKGNHMALLERQYKESIVKEEEQQEMEREKRVLMENVKEAQNASKQKTAFLSLMSHEIRTPINAILGLNEMIVRESHEESTLQYAHDIENAGKQLLGLVNDVLDFSKIDAGKMEIVPQKYNLKDVIVDLKNMFEPKSVQKNLEYKIDIDMSVPAILYGDEIRIKQVIINLLSNAFKYTDQGNVCMNLSYKKKDEKTIQLYVFVKDTGIGLKDEEISRLETPFERFDLKRNRSIQGTGLGIPIIVKILKQMGSELKVESEYGKGSTFSFVLEQEVLDWKALEEEMKQEIPTEEKDKQAVFHASKAKILVVDDSKINLKVAQGLLKRTGVQVTTATSGKECLKLCEQEAFHLILMDHMMPEMDGIEAFHRIREGGGLNGNTPVVALTANAITGANEFYRNVGFDAFLSKPMNPNKLEETIRAFLPQYVMD